jgi:hypothetical protein
VANYKISPPGEAVHPWVNKPDTKFAAGDSKGLYKTGLAVSGEPAAKFKAEVTAASEAAFAEYMEDEKKGGKLTPAQRKQWSVYYPFKDEEDAEGNPTGRVIFDHKQNAEIKMRDGSTKDVTIGIRDSADKAIETSIFSGDTIRTLYSMRAIPMVSLRKVGVRLDFAMVQLIEKGKRQAGAGGFGSFEGGYVGEEHETGGFGGGDAGGDY